MSSTLLNISGKLDQAHLNAYRAIVEATSNHSIPFFIVGATARDVVFEHSYNIQSPRLTRDVDIAIQLSDWDEFEELKKILLRTGDFVQSNVPHRLTYNITVQVDLVPFGAITAGGSTLHWPREDTHMNVLGFEEAFHSALTVRLSDEPTLDVPVAAPRAQIVLKLIAWSERAPADKRDARDLEFLLHHYMETGAAEYLHERHADLLDDSFDFVRVGARIAGRAIGEEFSAKTKAFIHDLLSRQVTNPDNAPLAEDMTANQGLVRFEQNRALIAALLQGLND